MKKILVLSAIFLTLPLFANNEKPDYQTDLKKLPFGDVINWNLKSQREKYHDILKENYDLVMYEIQYINNQRKEIENPWSKKETLVALYDKEDKLLVGYIWVLESFDLPNLFYKQNPGILEPKLVYGKINRYEIIYEIADNKKLPLSSFEILSLNWLQKKFAGDILERKKRIVRPPGREYLFTDSAQKIFDQTNTHFKKLKNLHQRQIHLKLIWVKLNNQEREEFKKIKNLIKNDVKEYGGNDWEKTWKKIIKIWPAMKQVK